MGCASANDLCAANWFSRHSWAFQYVYHQLFDSGMSSKDVKHNPGQHYQRPKNYELFSQKKKEIRKKKLATVIEIHFAVPRHDSTFLLAHDMT